MNIMNKKALGMSLMGSMFFFGSCVDDTYDFNKGIETDVKIEGNQLALPLGSLPSIELDSLVKGLEDEISTFLEIDSETRAYSLSLSDTISEGVKKDELQILQKISVLSDEIEPQTVIPIKDEIGFGPKTYSLSKDLNLKDVELSDITLNAINEEFTLELEALTLDPITIGNSTEKVEFTIPQVDLKPIDIEEQRQETTFNIDDIALENVLSEAIDTTIVVEGPDVDMSKITSPTFRSEETIRLQDENVDKYLTLLENSGLISVPEETTIDVNILGDTKEQTVSVEFQYTLPREIDNLKKIELDGETSLVQFEVTNPKVLQGDKLNRTIEFDIEFPDNYKFALDPRETGYKLVNEHTISAKIPATGDISYIRFYLKEIGGLDNSRYYGFKGEDKIIDFKDEVTCRIKYVANGKVTISKGTTVEAIKEGISYTVATEEDFDVKEIYGDTNPIDEVFDNQDIDFSFSLDNLDYIKYIDEVVLDPTISKLHFTADIDKGFGLFDLQSDCRLALSFPKEFTFETKGMQLPQGVEYVQKEDGTSSFEVSSVDVFTSNDEWILPVSKVKIDKDVQDGKLDISTTITAKTFTGNQEGVFTIKEIKDIPLKVSAENLCEDRIINLKASPLEIAVVDVIGETNPIDFDFAKKTFDLDFDVKGELEHIKRIDYVEFNSNNPITITTSVKGFGNINFEDGSFIALRFPDAFVFDTERSTLRYDESKKAFIIEDLSLLENGKWDFYLQRININKEIKNNTLSIAEEITLEAFNNKGKKDVLYVAGKEFSLKEMRDAGLFGTQDIAIVVQKSTVEVTEMQAASKDINVDFASQTFTYPIDIESLDYITHIGSIDFEENNNLLVFHAELSGDYGTGKFDLAKNSAVDILLPESFKLDPSKSTIPQKGIEFVDSSHIQITSLQALNNKEDWKLAVKRIAVDEDIIDYEYHKDYTIKVNSRSANGEQGKLTIAAIDDLKLSDIQQVGGDREMEISIKESQIAIKDVEVSIENIGIDFEEQAFVAPIPTIENLDLIKEIKYISFKEEDNVIKLNISLDNDLGDFDLVDSKVRLNLPAEFVLDLKECNFDEIDGLEYNEAENAIYIESMKSIANSSIQLAIDRININQTIVDKKFDWDVNFSVTAISDTNEPNKLYFGMPDNKLRYSEVSSIMNDKTVKIEVEEAELSIDEAVFVSNGVTEKINEKVDIELKETIAEAIDQIHTIGFSEPVRMSLNISTTGLDKLDVPVNVIADIKFPQVFDIRSNDQNVIITDQGLKIDTAYSFKNSQDIQLELLVDRLDFTSLEGNCLTLTPDENGNRILEYTDSASITGTVSIADATISSEMLEGVSMDVNFTLDKVILNNFSGLYGGDIEPIVYEFELGAENGLDDLEKNGLTLSNINPELMLSLYNFIGIPVDVDLCIVGKDKEGNEIPTSKIAPEKSLHIKPAFLDEQGELVADTTRWFFTSNKDAEVPAGYEQVVIENLATLLDELPYSISASLVPTIVTEDIVHHVDLSKADLGGSYSISVPFDLQIAQSIPMDFSKEVNKILRDKNNKLTLANPQLALSIYNPIEEDLVFDLSIVGKDANGQPIETFTIDFTDNPFVLKAGVRDETHDTITPTATRWLFAVNDEIRKEGFETKVAPALGTLLENMPDSIDIALNAHFNTDIATKIDYNRDLNLKCEYGVVIPLQFEELHFNYTDTISEIQLNLQETLEEMNISISNVELGIAMNLKNTLPIGLSLNLIPLDKKGNAIEGVEIGSIIDGSVKHNCIEIPVGNGSPIRDDETTGTPIELFIKCESTEALSKLDKIAFSIDVKSNNGDNALSGKQGLQIRDIVLQIMCDAEMDLGK